MNQEGYDTSILRIAASQEDTMDFSLFFTPASRLPSGCGITMYGPEHLIWLASMLAVGILISFYFRTLSQESQRKFLQVFSLVIIAQEIVKDILFIAAGGFQLDNLPLHLCGISIFICAAAAFTENKLARQLLYAVVFPGAASALLFPNWLQYPVLNFSSINSFTIHSYLILFTVLSILGNRFRPDFRALPKCFAFLGAIAVPIFFLNKVWNTNFLFINTPSEGSPLVFLEHLLGNPGYLLGLAVMFWLVWGILYLPWIIAKQKNPA